LTSLNQYNNYDNENEDDDDDVWEMTVETFTGDTLTLTLKQGGNTLLKTILEELVLNGQQELLYSDNILQCNNKRLVINDVNTLRRCKLTENDILQQKRKKVELFSTKYLYSQFVGQRMNLVLKDVTKTDLMTTDGEKVGGVAHRTRIRKEKHAMSKVTQKEKEKKDNKYKKETKEMQRKEDENNKNESKNEKKKIRNKKNKKKKMMPMPPMEKEEQKMEMSREQKDGMRGLG